MINRTNRLTGNVDRSASSLSTSPPATPGVDEGVGGWLDVLDTMIGLSPAMRQAIRDELAEHLHDRVRDLILTGRTETDAVRHALGELGEIAELAQRLERANRPRNRRRVMNLICASLGGVGVVSGVIALSTPSLVPVSVAPNEHVMVADDMPSGAADVRISVSSGASLDEFTQMLGQTLDLPVYVRVDELMASEIDTGTEIGIELDQMSLETLLPIVTDRYKSDFDHLEWRFRDDLIEVGTRSSFDRRESIVVSYDVEMIVEGIMMRHEQEFDEAGDRLVEVIAEFTEPELWECMGGDLARAKFVSGQLFIKAPSRLQGRVQWILEQLAAGDAEFAGFDPRMTTPGHGASDPRGGMGANGRTSPGTTVAGGRGGSAGGGVGGLPGSSSGRGGGGALGTGGGRGGAGGVNGSRRGGGSGGGAGAGRGGFSGGPASGGTVFDDEPGSGSNARSTDR